MFQIDILLTATMSAKMDSATIKELTDRIRDLEIELFTTNSANLMLRAERKDAERKQEELERQNLYLTNELREARLAVNEKFNDICEDINAMQAASLTGNNIKPGRARKQKKKQSNETNERAQKMEALAVKASDLAVDEVKIEEELKQGARSSKLKGRHSEMSYLAEETQSNLRLAPQTKIRSSPQDLQAALQAITQVVGVTNQPKNKSGKPFVQFELRECAPEKCLLCKQMGDTHPFPAGGKHVFFKDGTLPLVEYCPRIRNSSIESKSETMDCFKVCRICSVRVLNANHSEATCKNQKKPFCKEEGCLTIKGLCVPHKAKNLQDLNKRKENLAKQNITYMF